MQFEHPEILGFLGLIIIPIIIHLFQFQKFQKTYFTNVEFLKKLQLQHRKSSKLKKWLLLLTRILIISSIVIAFAKPYFPNDNFNKDQSTTIYLDNAIRLSSSMVTGDLVKKYAQEIIKNVNSEKQINLITNDECIENIPYTTLEKKLLNLKPTPSSKSQEQLEIELQRYANSNTILISDFKFINKKFDSLKSPSEALILDTKSEKNIYIDTVFVKATFDQKYDLHIVMNNQHSDLDQTTIALYKEDKLVTKKQVLFNGKNKLSETIIKLNNQDAYAGKITFEDDNNSFDNDFYFSINKTPKTNVLCIGKPDPFLAKLFPSDYFNFNIKPENRVTINDFESNDLVILYGLQEINQSFVSYSQKLFSNGNHLMIIPSNEINLYSYNQFLTKLKVGSVLEFKKTKSLINTITYQHPIFRNVFTEKKSNFNYPYSNSYYLTNFPQESSVLKFDNGASFLSEVHSKKGNIYWFSSSIKPSNSNFYLSELIVPVFYNIANKNSTGQHIYKSIDIPEHITLENPSNSILKIGNFTPIQQINQKKTSLFVDRFFDTSGLYPVTNKGQDTLQYIATNFAKKESTMIDLDLKRKTLTEKGVKIIDTVSGLQKSLQVIENKLLFKWFLGLAILFLLIEIGIIKFLKE